jgi:hypothetical protein
VIASTLHDTRSAASGGAILVENTAHLDLVAVELATSSRTG